MGIYEIDKQILQYIDDETGEIVDLERFLQLQIEKTKKIENIGLYIKNLESEAKEIKCEENSLQERRRAKENKAKRLRKLLTDVLKGEKVNM